MVIYVKTAAAFFIWIQADFLAQEAVDLVNEFVWIFFFETNEIGV